MITLLVATRNPHKAAEIQNMLGNGFRISSLAEYPGAPDLVEDAATFAGNATRKAVQLARWLAEHQSPEATSDDNTFVLADDSGLEVDALDGAPGVYSARFAALGTSQKGNAADANNNAKLLRLLEEVSPDERTARFRCALALARLNLPGANPDVQVFEGVCGGHILFAPRGQGGFGYDPLFVPDGFTQSFAELGEEAKNRISHRARALAKLKRHLAG